MKGIPGTCPALACLLPAGVALRRQCYSDDVLPDNKRSLSAVFLVIADAPKKEKEVWWMMFPSSGARDRNHQEGGCAQVKHDGITRLAILDTVTPAPRSGRSDDTHFEWKGG